MPLDGKPIKQRVAIGKSPGACWTWLGPTTPDGHGKLTFCGRDMLAHRWIWEQLFGPIPNGAVVYGTCATKGCVNPHHLACDWQAHACRQSVQTKLLPAEAAEIRAAKGMLAVGALAARYGVSKRTVWDIWAGRSWARARKHRAPNQKVSV